MLNPVVLVGALDTKGEEFRFVRDLIRARGLETLVVDFGVVGDPLSCPTSPPTRSRAPGDAAWLTSVRTRIRPVRCR